MFKRIIFFFITFFLLFNILLNSLLYIKNPNVINVGIPQFYPVVYKSYIRGAQGMFVDFLKEFCLRSNYRINFIYGDFDDLLKRMERGELDLLFPLKDNYRKKNKVIYAKTPFIENWCKIIVLTENGYRTLDELKGSKIGGLKKCLLFNSFLEGCKKKIGIGTKIYEDMSSLMIALRNKEIEGVMVSRFKYQFILKHIKNDFKINAFDCKEQKIKLYVGFGLASNRELVDDLNTFMKSQREESNSIYYSLKAKYFGKPVFSKNIFYIILVFIILLSMVIFFLIKNKPFSNILFNNLNRKDIYKRFFERYDFAVALCDNDFRIIDCNKLFLQFFEVSFDKLENNDLKDVLGISEALKSCRISEYYKNILQGEKFSFDFSHKLNEQEKTFSILAFPPKNRDIVVEIREKDVLKYKEKKLIEIERQESLGVLAAGIAHDFNNILVGITGNISLARKKSKDEKVLSYLEKAHKISLRAKALASQFLSFSKGGITLKENVNLWDLVEQSKEISFSGSNVKVLLYKPKGDFFVEADDNQIIQVFTNIFINAKQAMEFGGTVDISLNVIHLNDKLEETISGKKYYAVAIKDNGPGISEEQQKMIFNAFYSTKEKGSGLGLAVSKSIMKKHNGLIKLSSTFGEGSNFIVILPAVIKKEIVGRACEISKKDEYSDKGNVMILDDEPTVRYVLEDMLKVLGFTVYGFSSSKDIFEKYKELHGKGEKIELIFLDLILPGDIGGAETLKNIHLIDSKVKAVAISGYSEDNVTEQYEKYGFMGFLPKPFSLEELEDALMKIKEKLSH